MAFITRDQLDGMVRNPSVITEDELVNALERLGYSVFLEKKPELTEKQKERMTKAIFSNPDVLRQLKQAKANRDPELSSYSGDIQEFEKLVEEVTRS